MSVEIRRIMTVVEEIREEGGRAQADKDGGSFDGHRLAPPPDGKD